MSGFGEWLYVAYGGRKCLVARVRACRPVRRVWLACVGVVWVCRVHDRQSPMKNLEVKFSLSELEFRCKNLGKALGSKNLMVAFFICNPPLLHGGSYVKVGK